MAKSNSGNGNTRKRAPKPPAGNTEQAPRSATPQAASKPGDGQANVTAMPRRLSGEELQEAIRRRAFELYCERGRQGGNPEDDWRRAEQEILRRHAPRTA